MDSDLFCGWMVLLTLLSLSFSLGAWLTDCLYGQHWRDRRSYEETIRWFKKWVLSREGQKPLMDLNLDRYPDRTLPMTAKFVCNGDLTPGEKK